MELGGACALTPTGQPHDKPMYCCFPFHSSFDSVPTVRHGGSNSQAKPCTLFYSENRTDDNDDG